MKHQKLNGFKIIGRKTASRFEIAWKGDNNIVYTVTDMSPIALKGGGFTFHLGRVFTLVTLERDNKGEYFHLVQPAKDEDVKLYLVDKDAYKKFIQTDYNGRQR